jgi:transcriptional regulator with XRE-family HTH domain
MSDNLGFAARSKRKLKRWSQEYLAEKVGVSVGVIGKFENGHPVKDELKDKILLHLGMMDALRITREDRSIIGYKTLSLEELKTVVQVCRDMIREGNEDEKVEFMNYRNLAQREMNSRIREFFKVTN